MSIQPKNTGQIDVDSINEKTPTGGIGLLAQVTAREGINYLTSVGGLANAITATLVPAPVAVIAGQRFLLVPTSANTGSATLNIASLGAKTIKTAYGQTLLGGELQTTGIYDLVYNGTDMILLNPTPTYIDWSASVAYSASGSMTFTSVTTNEFRYVRDGKTVTFFLHASGTTGGTASTSINVTLPIAAANGTSAPSAVSAQGRDATSGSTANILCGVIDSANALRVFKSDASNWGLGTGRTIRVSGSYRIA